MYKKLYCIVHFQEAVAVPTRIRSGMRRRKNCSTSSKVSKVNTDLTDINKALIQLQKVRKKPKEISKFDITI